MTSMELVGLNTKWYRYQNNLTQEQYANKTKFKIGPITGISVSTKVTPKITRKYKKFNPIYFPQLS